MNFFKNGKQKIYKTDANHFWIGSWSIRTSRFSALHVYWQIILINSLVLGFE